MSKNISREILLNAFDYDPLVGVFSWKENRSSQARKGKVAGSNTSDGYLSFKVNGFLIYAHRAAWLYHYGVLPSCAIDHINGDKKDNRIANLREITAAGNVQNLNRAKKHNRSGFLGVSSSGASGKWTAKIRIGDKRIHIGTFKTPEEAHSAYLKVKKSIHPFWSGISTK